MNLHIRMRRRLYQLKAPGPVRTFKTAIPLLITAVVVCAFDYSEPSFRLAGMALQLAGLISVVIGLNQTRGEFGMPAIHTDIGKWISNFWSGKPSYVEADAISVGASLVGLRLTSFLPGAPENATLEERISRLERGVEMALDGLNEANQLFDKETAKLSSMIKAEGNARAQAVSKIEVKIQQVSTGGLWLSFMGTVWLFFGVILGSASPELFGLFANKS